MSEHINIQDPSPKRKVKLTPRELEVLYLIAFENTNTEIAKKLFLSKGTIDTYRNNLLAKLSAKNTAGVVRIAFESGILILDEKSKISVSFFQKPADHNVTHHTNNVVDKNM